MAGRNGGASLSDGTGDDDGRGVVEALYTTHAPRLVALARTLTGSVDAADDLVQETFLGLLRACRRDPNYVREPAWPLLRTMLARLAGQRRRSVGRELRRLARAYARPSEGIWDSDLEVVEALLSLPPRMRACVVLHYGEDMPVADVAQAMNTAPATVAAQLQVARKRLRKRLELDDAAALGSVARRNHRG
jgi:RNA polymerase sigma-70 factor (ECF subfamily)